MKKLIFVFSILFLLAVNIKAQKAKIIPDYEKEYNYSGFTGTENSKVSPQLMNEYFPENISPALKLELTKYLSKYKNKFKVQLRLFVDENGKLNFVKFLLEPPFVRKNKKLKEGIVRILSKRKLSTFRRKGKPIKSAYDVTLTAGEFDESQYFVAVERMPVIVGGLEALAKNVKYPAQAKAAGVQGVVIIKVYIDEKGNVNRAVIIKGIGYGCDRAALDAIKKVRFVPGQMNGKPVKVQLVIPVSFRLN